MIPGSVRSARKGMASHSSFCLQNSLDRGAWWATVHGIAESDMAEWLTQTHIENPTWFLCTIFFPLVSLDPFYWISFRMCHPCSRKILVWKFSLLEYPCQVLVSRLYWFNKKSREVSLMFNSQITICNISVVL